MANTSKTIMGIKVTANPAIFTDVYVVKDMAKLAKMDTGEVSFSDIEEKLDLLIETGKKFFGPEQYTKIESSLRKQNDGVLPIEALGNFIGESFQAFAPKNS